MCACLIGGVILCGKLSGNGGYETECIKYLESKYHHPFILVGEADREDRKIRMSYEACPKDNCDILFTVMCVETQQQIFPFFPPVKQISYRDNFQEQLKEYVTSKHKEPVILNSKKDIPVCMAQIVSLMEEIQDIYKIYYIPVTDYSCGIKLNVQVNGSEKAVNFYQKNESVIQDILSDSLKGQGRNTG